jgi:Kef-type K+ transport system membrane component KefB
VTSVYALAALWVGLALIATLLSIWLRIATAMSEIVVGTVAQLLIGAAFGTGLFGATTLGTDQGWIQFLSSVGAVLLTFLAGVELDPEALRKDGKEAFGIGLLGFLAPFLGCAAVARWWLGWSVDASWLTGIALSTTSVAVVYAVMLELGLNRTRYGKGVLAACFINDLATVLALGLMFAPFTLKTLIFVTVCAVSFVVLPWLTPRFFRRFGNRPSELETKFLLLVLFGLGAMALWAGSEPVLPAYVVGMILAGTVGKDHALVRRLRTLTLGFLTPFYFIRAGSFVSVPALASGFGIFLALLGAKMAAKFIGVYPMTQVFRSPRREAMYTTLLMSTGLTFGSISALYGLNHQIVDQAQYSFIIAAVVGSAVVPTLIANALFLPHHLLPRDDADALVAGVQKAKSRA